MLQFRRSKLPDRDAHPCNMYPNNVYNVCSNKSHNYKKIDSSPHYSVNRINIICYNSNIIIG